MVGAPKDYMTNSYEKNQQNTIDVELKDINGVLYDGKISIKKNIRVSDAIQNLPDFFVMIDVVPNFGKRDGRLKKVMVFNKHNLVYIEPVEED